MFQAALIPLVATLSVQADQVELQNGDLYTGKVISLNADTLVVQSEVLGTLLVPRGKVATITLGSNVTARATGATPAPVRPPARTAAATDVNDFSAALRQLGTNTGLIQQVQAQFLSGAGPEANSKFNELVSGLASGKVTLTDLRVQAKASADQLRALKQDLGDDAGWALDGYLSILDDFVKESEPATLPSMGTNSPSKKP